MIQDGFKKHKMLPLATKPDLFVLLIDKVSGHFYHARHSKQVSNVLNYGIR